MITLNYVICLNIVELTSCFGCKPVNDLFLNKNNNHSFFSQKFNYDFFIMNFFAYVFIQVGVFTYEDKELISVGIENSREKKGLSNPHFDGFYSDDEVPNVEINWTFAKTTK